ncbi:golgin subfamily A member 1-like [Ruditapes philippinarum]|uniref:golgin subfamily A member 1-like n=1 Tax=Ruditapes philippinarum TaxID=129788 RepID=UPI00295A5D93|nr:golgin subfamily A member 1-like [Ruditapes philippinarum]
MLYPFGLEVGHESVVDFEIKRSKFKTKVDLSSKEDLLVALQKRTDQCKKLEARNSEYVNAMKDNAKKIEKLEAYIEKQQDVLAKRTQELNEQYQASRIKLSDTYKLELEQKEKEKQDLEAKLKEAESMTKQYYKKEEEKEEMQQFKTQEMGKLKHMLILKEEELDKCQNELQELQKNNKDLASLDEKVKSLQSEKCNLEEEIAGHGKIVSALTKERITLEESLNDVKSQLSEKSSAYSSLQSKFTELESAHQTLIHSSDQQKHKLNQQIQEQKDEIEQLADRLSLLQQREQDNTLSGDDRLVAIEKERDGLERKLTETREQLSQIKSSWSEKISHLEDQISHLNGKIVEDSEELAEAKQYTETVRENMQTEIENLKKKLKDAEKEVQQQVDLLSRKEARFKKERLELETEVSKMKLEKVDLDTHLRAKLTSVESELMGLELSKAQEKSQLQDTIHKQEQAIADLEHKLGNSEEQVKSLEENLSKLQAEMKGLQTKCKSLEEDVKDKEKKLHEAKTHAQSLQEEVILTQEKLDKAVHSSKSKISELQESNKDKDDFMLRNAELSQQLTTLQQTLQDEKHTIEAELESHKENEKQLRDKCQELEIKIGELTDFQSGHLASNEQVIQLEDTVTSLEEQLAEKNKALKKQEQRLNDLKKTLQRELKVQSLPNDEPIDPKVSALTPPLPRKNSLTQKTHHSDHSTRTRRISSHDRSPVPTDPVMDTVDGINNSIGTQDFFLGDNSPHNQHKSSSERISFGVPNSHATISVTDSRGPAGLTGAFASNGQFRNREFETRHLEKDINFQYLKHVVMKFMLSREHEAIQLIKAVSLLLRFTPEEQKLIRDTLQWKMSWFGGSQPPAVLKGQTNKIIPPSW